MLETRAPTCNIFLSFLFVSFCCGRAPRDTVSAVENRDNCEAAFGRCCCVSSGAVQRVRCWQVGARFLG